MTAGPERRFRPTPVPALVTRVTVALMSMTVGFALGAYALSLMGLFRLGPLVIAGFAAGYSLYVLWGWEREDGGIAPWAWPAVVAVAVMLFHGVFATGTVIVGDDPAAHAAAARMLAATGATTPDHADTPFASLDAAAPPGFGDGTLDVPRLYPATAALLAFIGDRGLFVAGAILLGLATWMLYVFAVQRVRWGAAVMVMLAVGFGPLGLYAARDGRPESFALAAAAFGVWTLSVAEDRRARGVVAGVALGAASVATTSTLLGLAALGVYLLAIEVGGWQLAWIARQRRRAFVAAVMAGAAIPLTLAVVDAVPAERMGALAGRLWLPALVVFALGVGARVLYHRPISFAESLQRVPGWVPSVLVLVIGLALLLLRPATAGSEAVAAVGAAQAAEGVPVDATRTYSEQSLWWLLWYVWPATVVAGLFGWVTLAWRNLRGLDLEWRPVMVFGAVPLVFLVLDPGVLPLQPAAAIGYLPFVVPMLTLGAAWVVDRLWDDPGQPALQLGALLIGTAVVGMPLVQTVLVWDYEPQPGAYAALMDLCDDVDVGGAVVVAGEPSGSADRLALPLAAYCEIPVIGVVELTPGQVVTLGIDWVQQRRDLRVLTYAPRPELGTEPLGRWRFEEPAPTVERPPRDHMTTSWELHLAP